MHSLTHMLIFQELLTHMLIFQELLTHMLIFQELIEALPVPSNPDAIQYAIHTRVSIHNLVSRP